MKKNKLLGTVFIVLSTSSICHAQSDIYKCVQPDGNVLYLNDKSQMKSLNCDKTDLAKIDKLTTLNKPVTTSNKGTTNLSLSSVGNNIESLEQKARDDKRALILRQELSQEQNQLKTVAEMLKNVEKSSDNTQIEQLKKMQDNHSKNIASLQKELGIKTDVELVVDPSMLANVSKSSLPTTIPTTVNTTSSLGINNANIAVNSKPNKEVKKEERFLPAIINPKKIVTLNDKPSPKVTYSGKDMSPVDFLKGK